MIDTEKSAIRASFNRAAVSYDEAALVQKQACHYLLKGLQTESLPTQMRILDAGCGTGFGAKQLQLQYPQAHIYLVDFAPAMALAAQRSGCDVCIARIEALPFAAASFELWWSNLVVQWCDLGHVLQEASRVLQPGGKLAFSTLGPDTFRELRSAFQSVDSYQHTITFLDLHSIEKVLQMQGWQEVRLQQQNVTLHYPNLKTLLRSIKAVGANHINANGRSGLMSRRQWNTLEHAYEALRTPAGLPLSYQVLLAYARVHVTP